MKKIELLNMLSEFAKDYRSGCEDSINQNKHINELNGKCEVDQKVVDAILVDYINYIAFKNSVDFGMYTKDLID